MIRAGCGGAGTASTRLFWATFLCGSFSSQLFTASRTFLFFLQPPQASPPRVAGSMCTLSPPLPLGDEGIPAPVRREPASDGKLEHVEGARKAEDDRTLGNTSIVCFQTSQIQASSCDRSLIAGDGVSSSPETQFPFKAERNW